MASVEVRVEREALGQGIDPAAQGGQRGVVGVGSQRVADDVGDLGEGVQVETAGGERGGADPHAGADHRRTRVERNGVAVHGDSDAVQPVFGLLAVEFGFAQIDQHQVHVGAAGRPR